MLTIADLKAQFTKLSAAVAALDLTTYLKELPGLAEVIGHPEQAAELRTLLTGLTEGSVRDVVKGTEGLVNDALAAYYHFPKLVVTAGTGDKDFANLHRCLAAAAECCDGTVEHPKVGATGTGIRTANLAISPADVAAIGRLILSILTFLQEFRKAPPVVAAAKEDKAPGAKDKKPAG